VDADGGEDRPRLCHGLGVWAAFRLPLCARGLVPSMLDIGDDIEGEPWVFFLEERERGVEGDTDSHWNLLWKGEEQGLDKGVDMSESTT
jgi:hypothetical protein